MKSLNLVVVACVLSQAIGIVLSIHFDDDDLSDYDFEEDQPEMIQFHSDPELRSIESIVMREMAEDEPPAFNEKEKRVRDALLRSTQDARNRRTFSEVLPILRSLTRQQRLTLAALVSAQTNVKSGKSFDLKQVSTPSIVNCFFSLLFHLIQKW